MATDVGGNREVVVEGETGYLVPLEDEAGLIARIVELLGQPELGGKMGHKGRGRVEKESCFKWMLQAYLENYQGKGKDSRSGVISNPFGFGVL